LPVQAANVRAEFDGYRFVIEASRGCHDFG
jgi:hypothetical protein